MPDQPITLIICGRGKKHRCYKCGKATNKLCDYPLTGPMQGKTCDRPVCTSCALHREPDRDYCPPHGRLIEINEAAQRSGRGQRGPSK